MDSHAVHVHLGVQLYLSNDLVGARELSCVLSSVRTKKVVTDYEKLTTHKRLQRRFRPDVDTLMIEATVRRIKVGS